MIRPGFYKSRLGLANGGRKARRVNPSTLLKSVIDVPPIAEQRAISRCIDLAEGTVASFENYAAHLRHQKAGLMQQLLTGRTRVPETAGVTHA